MALGDVGRALDMVISYLICHHALAIGSRNRHHNNLEVNVLVKLYLVPIMHTLYIVSEIGRSALILYLECYGFFYQNLGITPGANLSDVKVMNE